MTFLIEVDAGGLLAGVMYALVELGFVLIYKASGVFNFAQGSMVFFAALTFVSLLERGWNLWLPLAAPLAPLGGVGLLSQRTRLRPPPKQPPLTPFMATTRPPLPLAGG